MLTKTRMVLTQIGSVGAVRWGDASLTCFSDQDAELPPEDRGRRHFVMVETEVWDDMGRPEVVTVTIEPGDHLNS